MPTIGKSSSKKTQRKKIQHITSIPAPIGGLNARDALSAMPPTDAFGLINWIPQRYGVRVRKGYSEWAINLGAAVGTVFSYFAQTDTIPGSSNFQTAPTTMPGKVFAATDSNIYDVTSRTNAPTSVVTLSNSANAGSISSVNFTNAGSSWLLACSETDGYYTFDGTTWVKVTLGAGATQVSVGDPTKFCACAIWKNRAWFVQKSSSKVWYLPVNAIYGAAAMLDLGPVLKHGGAIAWISNWTIDAGEGIDDYLVIASEQGDIVVYKGTDPASPTTFSLVGVWYAGEIPKGRRGFTAYGGDLLLISNIGITPMSYITRGGSNVLSATEGNITANIVQLFSNDISQTFNFFGWELALVPREDLMVATVPFTNGINLQYALNTSSEKWCQFNNMPMTCAKVVANWLMFGTSDGRVCLAFDSFTDNNPWAGGVGNGISGLVQPAFSYFQQSNDSISAQKHFLMVQPTFLSLSPPGYSLQMNVDFATGVPLPPAIIAQGAGSVWDSSRWDQAVWGGVPVTYRKWTSVTGVGFTGQVSLATLTNVDTILASIDYMFEMGGPI